jgi:opacity protein-like surface antigen
MKKIMLITSLSLLITCQAQAAKFLSGSDTSSASAAKPASAPTASSPSINTISPTLAQASAPTTAPRTAASTTTSGGNGIDTGFYIGAQLGDSSIGAVMGYQFTKMFGMEVSYDYFDPHYTRAVTTTTAEKNILGASGLAMFPMKFSEMGPMALYVKVGYARTTDKLTTDDPGLPPSIPSSTFITITTKTGVTGGAGIHVDMSKSASVRLGVNVVGDQRTTYLAALYRF